MTDKQDLSKVELYSFSKLELYNKCSYAFKNQYIDKVIKEYESTLATEIGSWCHEALEQHYGSDNSDTSYNYFVNTWKEMLQNYGIYDKYNDFSKLANQAGQLYTRAAYWYKGSDAITTSRGELVKDLPSTRVWKDEIGPTDYNKIRASLDQLMMTKDPKWKSVSPTDVFVQSSWILYNYQNPAQIKEIYAIEYGLSELVCVEADPMDKHKPLLKNSIKQTVTKTKGSGANLYINLKTGEPEIVSINNPVKLGENQYLNGFIDLICKTPDGKWAIIDHKTSGGLPPSVDYVKHHQQLLLYGWAIKQITGIQVDYIGINHLRTNQLILAPYDNNLGQQAVDNRIPILKAIKHDIFIKQDPLAFGSPCMRQGKSGLEYCAFASTCHPWLKI